MDMDIDDDDNNIVVVKDSGKKKSDLPEGWVVLESEKHPGKVYYYNTFARTSQWDKPKDSGKDASSVTAYHILVKHKDCRNPFSKSKNASVTRTREEALEIIKEIRSRLMEQVGPAPSASSLKESIAALSTIAKAESDCSSSKRGGDLGPFTRGKMTKSFEDAAFSLKVGELSGIIESPSGFHVVLRTA